MDNKYPKLDEEDYKELLKFREEKRKQEEAEKKKREITFEKSKEEFEIYLKKKEEFENYLNEKEEKKKNKKSKGSQERKLCKKETFQQEEVESRGKGGLGFVFGFFFGLIGLVILILLYNSDTVERKTSIQGWGFGFVTALFIGIILGVILSLIYHDWIAGLFKF